MSATLAILAWMHTITSNNGNRIEGVMIDPYQVIRLLLPISEARGDHPDKRMDSEETLRIAKCVVEGADARCPQDHARRHQIVCIFLRNNPAKPRNLGPRSHRLTANSAISFECFRIRSIRLVVNSAMTLGNSKGDLIQASL